VAGWTAKLTTVVIFSVLAVGELVWDKLPWVPARTMPTSLLVRVVFGAWLARSLRRGWRVRRSKGHPGWAGSDSGACAGYHIRRALVEEADGGLDYCDLGGSAGYRRCGAGDGVCYGLTIALCGRERFPQRLKPHEFA